MILIGTESGLVALDDGGHERFRALGERQVSYLSADGDGRLLAIADESELLAVPSIEQADREEPWRTLGALPGARANCLAELGGRIFIGAEDARMWVLPSEGGEPERISSFDAVPSRDEWDTPWGGPPDVRSLAIVAGEAPAVYADIHVGWIVRSLDLGETWTQLRDGLHRDVHRVSTHRDRPDRVYAATAQGCFVSEDRGDSWRQHLAPFEPRNYQRCVVPDFADPDLFLCTASLGPHPSGETGCEAMIFRTEDAGESWEAAHGGLPPHFYHNINTHMLAASVQRPGVFAFHDDEENVYLTTDAAREWRKVATVAEALTVFVL
ncbi:MAG: WD40/YVTN/BNR-like repeat-containing protein [Armatimonadota bacterium]